MTLDDDLHQLTVVGSLPAGGKLGHNLDGKLFVSKPGFLGLAWRLLRGEGRDRTCETVQKVLTAAEERLLDLSHNRFLGERDSPESYNLTSRVRMLTNALQLAKGGIINLKITYAADLSAQASLDLLLQKCSGILDRANSLSNLL